MEFISTEYTISVLAEIKVPSLLTFLKTVRIGDRLILEYFKYCLIFSLLKIYRIMANAFITALLPAADFPTKTVICVISGRLTSLIGPRFFIIIDSLIINLKKSLFNVRLKSNCYPNHPSLL